MNIDNRQCVDGHVILWDAETYSWRNCNFLVNEECLPQSKWFLVAYTSLEFGHTHCNRFLSYWKIYTKLLLLVIHLSNVFALFRMTEKLHAHRVTMMHRCQGMFISCLDYHWLVQFEIMLQCINHCLLSRPSITYSSTFSRCTSECFYKRSRRPVAVCDCQLVRASSAPEVTWPMNYSSLIRQKY